jgi:hypothetical protein
VQAVLCCAGAGSTEHGAGVARIAASAARSWPMDGVRSVGRCGFLIPPRLSLPAPPRRALFRKGLACISAFRLSVVMYSCGAVHTPTTWVQEKCGAFCRGLVDDAGLIRRPHVQNQTRL